MNFNGQTLTFGPSRPPRTPRANGGNTITNTAPVASTTNPRPRRRGRRVRSTQFVAVPRNVLTAERLVRRPGRGRAPRNLDPKFESNELSYARTEIIGDVVAGVNTFTFVPGRSGMRNLDVMAGLYGNWRLESCTAHFKSAVSRLVSGAVVMGIDYQTASIPLSKSDIANLDGVQSTNLYLPLSIAVAPSKVNKLTWTPTYHGSIPSYAEAPFSVNIFCDTPATSDSPAVLGSMWITYAVVFMGADLNAETVVGAATASAVSQIPIIANAPVPAVMQGATESSINQTDDPVLSVADNILISSEDPTELATTFTVAHSVFGEVGDTIIGTSLQPTDVSLNSVPTVNFRYSDNTPIPVGTITAIPVTNYSSFLYGSGVSGVPQRVDDIGEVFASLFKLAKPLIKQIPIIGEIVSTVFDPAALATTVYLPGTNIIAAVEDANVESVVSAFAVGDSIDVVIPKQLVYNWSDAFTGGAILMLDYPNNRSRVQEYGPYTLEYLDVNKAVITIVDPTNFPLNDGISIAFVRATTQSLQAPFTAGDVLALSSFTFSRSDGTGNPFFIFGQLVESALTNMSFVDGLPAETPAFTRVAAILEDNVAIVVPFHSLPPLGADNVDVVSCAFSRQSRSDSEAILPPLSTVVPRRLTIKM